MARPTKKVTPEDRKRVETLSGYGLSAEQIANVLEMHRNTLAKHCKRELERGRDLAKAQVVQALFSNIKKGKEASIFFYLKTQCGWRETNHLEVAANIRSVISAEPMSEREWLEKYGAALDSVAATEGTTESIN